MKRLLWMAVIVAAVTTMSASAQKASFFQTNLFWRGLHGVNTYRIPAMVQTQQGTIIAVVDARKNSPHDLPADISLVMRRSFDEGTHWTRIRTIVSVPSGGVGDASLLLDRSNGRVWCFFNYGPPGIGFWTAKPGARTGPTTLQVHAMYSDDQGATWSKSVDITPEIKKPSWQAMFATSGTDIQLKDGRFLMPLVVRDAKGVIHSVNAYSDDHGKTWKVGKFIGSGTNESHPVELNGGVVMQNMRDGSTREIARSTNGGESFGPVYHDSALIDPGCNAGITRFRSGGKNLLIFTNAANQKTRRNLTVKVSYDQGKTWPVSRVIDAGSSGYSTVIRLKNGDVGVLYERGGPLAIRWITFARFNLKWIEQGSARSHK